MGPYLKFLTPKGTYPNLKETIKTIRGPVFNEVN